MSAFGFNPSAIPPALANRVLEREAWAQTRLAAHGGSVFAVVVGPVATTMRIEASGKIESAPFSGRAPDLTLTLSPLKLPSFLAEPARWDEFVVADGDPALATTLKGLAETLPWFVERALAEALGPIVGQRIADTGRRLLAFPEYANARIGESVASFARDEATLAAHAAEARSFGAEVAATATGVDALALRIDALAARLAAPPPGKRFI
jgi:ubiquinone biosynthesis protein UbiJ